MAQRVLRQCRAQHARKSRAQCRGELGLIRRQCVAGRQRRRQLGQQRRRRARRGAQYAARAQPQLVALTNIAGKRDTRSEQSRVRIAFGLPQQLRALLRRQSQGAVR